MTPLGGYGPHPTTASPPAGTDVLVLGAGFSRAISTAMPTADELGQEIVNRLASENPSLDLTPTTFSSDHPFEAYLSLLAERQPHLTETENRRNATRFSAITDALVTTLNQDQDRAFAETAPPWLYDLLTVCHCRQTTIITFNYDTLVEAALASYYLRPADVASVRPPVLPVGEEVPPMPYFPRISSQNVLGNQPPLDEPGEVGWEGAKTLQLLKLHGSLDWSWVPGDPIGSTLVRQPDGAAFGAPAPMSEAERRRARRGREPFIVPPLATK